MEFSLESGRDVLSRTPISLDVMLRDLSDQWMFGDEGPGTWSPYQVVGHLVHVEEVDWMDRTRVILGGGESTFKPIDREAGFTRFEGWSAQSLLDRFKVLRASNLEELDALVGPEDLMRRGVHPDFGTVSLSELLSTWVAHDLNHIGQIVKAMAKQYRDAVGPWRAFLPIVDAE